MEFPGVASIGGFAKSVSMKLAFRSFSVLIVLASCSFLVYKLCTFQQYEVLFIQWKQMPLSSFWWLAGLLSLLPLNWSLEAFKWKLLAAPVQKINLTTSIKGVLSGISTGFFTPNRVGELVGRIAFLKLENRKAGVTLSLVNSLTQNIVMACCGIPACILFLSVTAGGLQSDMFYFISILIVGVLVLGADKVIREIKGFYRLPVRIQLKKFTADNPGLFSSLWYFLHTALLHVAVFLR